VLVYAPGSAMADPNLYVVSPFVAVPVSIIHLEAVSRFASTWADSPLQAVFIIFRTEPLSGYHHGGEWHHSQTTTLAPLPTSHSRHSKLCIEEAF
jgi:hypothetical protein